MAVKVERRPALPPAATNYHRKRKRTHAVCLLIFIALPFFNILRVDVPNQRFWFAGAEIAISEFAIAFFALMFLMFVIAASAILYGRIYCSYLCPQMIFSEASLELEAWARKKTRHPRLTFHVIAGVASVFLAFVFTSYFVEPADLLNRLLHFDIVTAGGITGAVITVLTWLDFTFLRQRFCTTVCPYGYLQGMLQDKNSLLVVYEDNPEAKQCIECRKCVRVCHMGIDIRDSPHQIECVHCGECVDACEDVLRKTGRPGIIHYTRVKFDAKRLAVVAILFCYAAGLALALSMRHPVAVQIAPDRTDLYTTEPDGRYANLMRMKLANRTRKTSTVRIWTEQLPGADLSLAPNPVTLLPGQTVEANFRVRAARTPQSSDVNHSRILAQTDGRAEPDAFDMTFIMPLAGSRNTQ